MHYLLAVAEAASGHTGKTTDEISVLCHSDLPSSERAILRQHSCSPRGGPRTAVVYLGLLLKGDAGVPPRRFMLLDSCEGDMQGKWNILPLSLALDQV